MADLTTEKINLYVDKKVKKNNDSDIGKSFKSLFSDFNLIPYMIGFTLALSFNKLLNNLSNIIIINIFKTKNTFLHVLIEFLLTILFVYVFIYIIYYKFLFNEDISKEKVVKKALHETRVDEAKKEIQKDKEIKKDIEKDIELDNNKSIEEYFMNRYSMHK